LHQDANRGVWSCRGIPTAPPVDLSALKQNVECDSNHLIDLHEPIKSMQNPAALGEYADPAAVLPWPASSTTAQKLLVGFLSGRLLSVLDIAWPQAEQPDIRLNTQIRLSLPSATALLPSLVDANRIWITSNQPFHAESQHQVLDLDLAGSMNARTQIAQVIDIGSAIEVGRIVKLLQLDNRRIVALTRHPDALLLLLAVEKQWQVVDVLSLGESSPVDILRIPTPENAPAEFVVASLTRDELYWISANTTHLQKISRLGLSGQGPIQMTLFYPGGQVSTERVAIAVSTFFDHGLSLVELSRPLALPIWRELGHYSSVNSAEDVGVSPR
jgi:hypothetical protein